MNLDSLTKQAMAFLVPAAISLTKAVVIWYIGRWAIRVGINLMRKTLSHNRLDATLIRYICSVLSGLLTVFLALGVMSIIGIETTSFAAVAAGAGLAIGAAWSGMLSNFAAGVFMIVMRPFKVGDHVKAAGVMGVVREIGLFAILVGNRKLFEDKIFNFTANPVRVCSVEFTIPSRRPFRSRLEELTAALQGPNDVDPKSARVRIRGFNYGPVLQAITECHQEYWEEVQGEMADAIERIFSDVGFGGIPAAARQRATAESGEFELGEGAGKWKGSERLRKAATLRSASHVASI